MRPIIDYNPPQPPEEVDYWQSRLDALYPRNIELSWFKLEWTPGEEWEPLHRWFLYQMIPAPRISPLVAGFLRGPNPRDYTYLDRVTGEVRRRRQAPMVSMQQWRLFRRYGCMAIPYWVIQGETGGHKLRFTRREGLIARTRGRPPRPPEAGVLPYAPMDERVIQKLQEQHRMSQYVLLLDYLAQNPGDLDREEQEKEKELEGQLWSWLSTQVDDILREAPHGVLEQMAGLDPTPRVFT